MSHVKTFCTFLAVALWLPLLSPAFGQHGQGTEPDQDLPQEFAAIYSTGENWETGKAPAEQAFFLEHSAFLFRLKQKGVIVAGIRVSEQGIILFKATNIEEARKIFMEDVSVKEKTFKLDVQPATVFYKGCL